jgi:hypothetical protein
VQKDRSDGLFDGIRFLVRVPKSQYRKPNLADDGLFSDANALNSLGKAAFWQAEFCLTSLGRWQVDLELDGEHPGIFRHQRKGGIAAGSNRAPSI